MTQALQELFSHFERELLINQRLGTEFAKHYPQVASGVGFSGSGADQDPLIRKLLQGCALLNARTLMQIEKSKDEFTEGTLQVNYPNYNRPFPPATIVRFDGEKAGATLLKVPTIARGTTLHSAEVSGTRCQFRTVYDVKFAPLRVADVQFIAHFTPRAEIRVDAEITAAMRIAIEITSDRFEFTDPAIAQWRLFIDADPSHGACFRDTLFMRVRQAWFSTDESECLVPLQKNPLLPVGFREDEAMIPFETRSHPAYRFLTEYFCFPEKFNFVDVDFAAFADKIPAGCRRITLDLGIAHTRDDSAAARTLASLPRTTLLPFCTPAVNLFRKAACAIDLDHTKAEYTLLADTSRASAYDIYSIDKVVGLKECGAGSTTRPYHPYYSIRHAQAEAEDGHYWRSRRDALMAETSPGYEHSISLVDRDFDPQAVEAATISIDLTCTNRALPQELPIGAAGGDLMMAHQSGNVPIRMLRKPTAPYRFPTGDHWRLISHLALNHYSLVQHDAQALIEVLNLYDLPRSPATQRQIGGIRGLVQRRTRVRWNDEGAAGFLDGSEVRLMIDQQAYAGSGIHAFAQIIEHFLGLHVHLNSFVELVIECHATGRELMRCKPRNGSLELL